MNIFGLPLHPLIVHAAVIFIPLAAVGALLVVVFPRLRERYGSLTALVAVGAALAAVAARVTGPALAEEIGLAGSARIARHEAFGTWTPVPVVVLLIVLVLFLWSASTRDGVGRTETAGGARRGGRAAGLRPVAAVLTVAAAIVSLVMVAITGHAGASAVWLP